MLTSQFKQSLTPLTSGTNLFEPLSCFITKSLFVESLFLPLHTQPYPQPQPHPLPFSHPHTHPQPSIFLCCVTSGDGFRISRTYGKQKEMEKKWVRNGYIDPMETPRGSQLRAFFICFLSWTSHSNGRTNLRPID